MDSHSRSYDDYIGKRMSTAESERNKLRAANAELVEALVESTHMLDEVFRQAMRLEDRNTADALAQRCAVNLALIAKYAPTGTDGNG